MSWPNKVKQYNIVVCFFLVLFRTCAPSGCVRTGVGRYPSVGALLALPGCVLHGIPGLFVFYIFICHGSLSNHTYVSVAIRLNAQH